jgi:hypothetical protein
MDEGTASSYPNLAVTMSIVQPNHAYQIVVLDKEGTM